MILFTLNSYSSLSLFIELWTARVIKNRKYGVLYVGLIFLMSEDE